MSATPLKVAVVGVGHLGKIHARIYAQNEASELAYVVDVDEARAREVGDALGAQVLGDISDLPDGIDAVSIVVPTSDHARVAIPLLERGVACLIEKPLASNLAEADLILAAAERGGAPVAVGHVERFQPGVRRLREWNLEPRFIESHRLTTFSFRAMDVGVVHDLMIHDLDLILHLVDSEVESLDAAGGRILTDTEDLASVRIVFRNGARANVTASRVSLSPMRRLRMFSSAGYVSLDFVENHGLFVRRGAGFEAGLEELRATDPVELAQRGDFVTSSLLDVQELELGGEERPLQAELDSFLTAIRTGSDPEVTGEDGRRALELADRIRSKIRSQAW